MKLLKFMLPYICGLALGLALFCLYPSFNYAKSMLQNALALADAYQESQTFPPSSSGPTRIAVFNTEGENILHLSPDGDRDPDTLAEDEISTLHKVERTLKRVLTGKTTTLFSLVANDEQGYNGIFICVGVPLYQDGSIAGALFQFRSYFPILNAFLTFCFLYTILYILLGARFVILQKKSIYQAEAEQLKRNYIDNVTHALKTPVNSVKMMAEALCDEVVDDPRRQKLYCGRILLETKKQERMIRDILKLSEIQNHRTDVSIHRTDPGVCFDPVIENYQELCDCMEITLHVSDPLSELPPLYTNAACIQEVMKVLLDNAMKFVPAGGDIWVDAKYKNAPPPGKAHTLPGKSPRFSRLWDRLRNQKSYIPETASHNKSLPLKNRVVICVRDNGTGIRPEDLPMIFERFYKRSGPENPGGSGLGLAIARELLQNLGEAIWAESTPGAGAAFYFTVRLEP